MHKVIEVATSLGVSKVTIYKKISSLGEEIKPFTSKKKGITYIDDAGVELIKKSLEVSTLVKNDTNNIYNAETAFTVEEDIPSDVSVLTDTINHWFEDYNPIDVNVLTDKLNDLNEDYINSLKEQISHLKEELNEKNNQLNNKDKLIENFQVLLKDTNKKMMLLEEKLEEKKEPKGFLSFFKLNKK